MGKALKLTPAMLYLQALDKGNSCNLFIMID
jgi:hypothetical protein